MPTTPHHTSPLYQSDMVHVGAKALVDTSDIGELVFNNLVYNRVKAHACNRLECNSYCNVAVVVVVVVVVNLATSVA